MSKHRGAQRPVVHLTLAHHPHDVRVFEKEAITLATAGYDVRLLVPRAEKERRCGVQIRPLPIGRGGRGFRAHLSRLLASFRAAVAEGPALVHLHDPELIPVGVALAARGIPVIYDAHENAPLEALTLNRGHRLRGGVLALTWWVYLAFAKLALTAFVAATPAIATTLPARRTVTVRNYPRLTVMQHGGTAHSARPRRAAYVGNISAARGLWQLLDALAALPAEDETELLFLGRFQPEQLLAEAERHPGWRRVRHHPWQPWSVVAEMLDECRVGVCALHGASEIMTSLPVKLFEYMAKGLPVVASDFPQWRPLVEDAGTLIDPLNAIALRTALIGLLDDPDLGEAMGRRGSERVRSSYDWDTEGRRLLALYDRLIGPPSGAA